MKKYLFTSIIAIAVIIMASLFVGDKPSAEAISLFSSNSTTTDATWSPNSKVKVLKTNSGTLRKVVVTGVTSATELKFYDATTTTSHPNHATTTIAVINTSTPAGTYEFDVAFTRGLVVEFPTSLGAASSTITWD